MEKIRPKITKEIKAITIDVFDTFLLRNSKPEIERFYEISRLHYLLLKKFKKITFNEVFFARQFANYIPYRLLSIKNEQECRIEDIYRIMLKILKIENNGIIHEMLDKEISYELNNLKVNKKLIKELKKINLKIFFISDMYLSKESIKKLINYHAKNFKYNDIYVSSEYNSTKKNGKLFDVFLEKEKLAKNEIMHIGNDFISDYSMPKSKSIKVFYYPRKNYFEFIKILKEKSFRFKNKEMLMQ